MVVLCFYKKASAAYYRATIGRIHSAVKLVSL
jgi:hypothetical protein